MADRFTNYGTGRQLAEGLGNIANDIRANTQRQERLAILAAQLRMQKVIADERNRSQETIAGIGADARRDVAKTGADASRDVADIGADARRDVADIGADASRDVADISATSREKVADIGADASRDVADIGATSRERVAGIQTASNEKINRQNIISRESIVDKQLQATRENLIMQETGLNDRLSKKLNSEMDMLVKSLASKKELMGMDIRSKMDLLDKEISGKGFLQELSQKFSKELQDDSQAFKLKLEEFTSGELNKRLMMKLESEEAIQVMLEGGRNSRNKDSFLFNKELQLDKANHQLMLQQSRQDFQSQESSKAFERTKEMSDINFEKQVMGSILELKAGKLQKQQDFNFVASPFSLGSTNQYFGLNYKEDDVLNTVQGNIPVLAEAVKIAKDLPRTVATQEAPWYKPWGDDTQTTQLDPRAENLRRVLVNYQKELNKSEFYNWGESSATKKKAKSALADVNSLIQMLDMPSSGASFESLIPSNY